MRKRNKIIWSIWYQGADEAPPLVQQCFSSWSKFNPEYTIRILDEKTLPAYINLPEKINFGRDDISVQKISSISRLALLKEYGGIWLDATVYCSASLDSWVDDKMGPDNFFAFRNPGRDRMISNWMFAAEPDSAILGCILYEYITFFESNVFPNQNTNLGEQLIALLKPVLNVDARSTMEWISPAVTRGLGIYPYFIFHYLFNKMILENRTCRRMWEQSPPMSSGPSHQLQNLESTDVNTRVQRATEHIDSKAAPLHKLNWRSDISNDYWQPILQHLNSLRK